MNKKPTRKTQPISPQPGAREAPPSAYWPPPGPMLHDQEAASSRDQSAAPSAPTAEPLSGEALQKALLLEEVKLQSRKNAEAAARKRAEEPMAEEAPSSRTRTVARRRPAPSTQANSDRASNTPVPPLLSSMSDGAHESSTWSTVPESIPQTAQSLAPSAGHQALPREPRRGAIPSELFPVADVIPLEALPLARQMLDLPSPMMADPYWDRLWTNGALGGDFYSAAPINDHQVLAPEPLPKSLQLSRAEALQAFRKPRGYEARLRALSIIASYGTVMAEQVAALSGARELLNPTAFSGAANFGTGLLSYGTPGRSFDRSSLKRPTTLMQVAPNSQKAFESVAGILNSAKRLAITGGRDWGQGHVNPRHDVINAVKSRLVV